jgi:hypothetical protein
VKEEERRIKMFMDRHKDNAQGILNNMHAATETGLMHEVFIAWFEFYKEEKQIAEYAEFMNGQHGKLTAFGDRNKKSAKSAMERAHEHGLTMLYLKMFGAWKLHTRTEQLLKQHMLKIEAKREQLTKVQQMFKNFAKQLESNIQAGADSNRNLADGPPAKYKARRSMGDGSVSLPDIHSKPGSAAA